MLYVHKYHLFCKVIHKNMFEHICSFRIENSINLFGLDNPTWKEDSTALNNISAAIDIHQKAIESVAIFISLFFFFHTFSKNRKYLY